MDEKNRPVTRAIYNVLALTTEGRKELLGMYISKSEGANFWLSVLTDLQARGVQDILIACVDGLKGFPDAIASVYPETTVQLCIVHQIRNSIKYVASRKQKEFMKDLKLVYQAVNKDAAEKALDDLELKWGEDYKAGEITRINSQHASSTLNTYEESFIPQIRWKGTIDSFVKSLKIKVYLHPIQLWKNLYI